jgi:hypothetical protein
MIHYFADRHDLDVIGDIPAGPNAARGRAGKGDRAGAESGSGGEVASTLSTLPQLIQRGAAHHDPAMVAFSPFIR